MINAGPYISLISQFNQNWRTESQDIDVQIDGHTLEIEDGHALYGELDSLCRNQSCSLPFFTGGEIIWCTMAPEIDSLRAAVSSLNSWIIPSFGGEKKDKADGFIDPSKSRGTLALEIIHFSPEGYYRWRSPLNYKQHILTKLALKRRLVKVSPERTRPPRPSLFELRARFCSSLLIGDRIGAEKIIQLLDSLQLETATNTQFMRIRLWHHFRELDRIRLHSDLPNILAQPMPVRVREWINEACGVPVSVPSLFTPISSSPEPSLIDSVSPISLVSTASDLSPVKTWIDWFASVKESRKAEAETFIEEHHFEDPDDFSSGRIEAMCTCLDEFVLDDALCARERGLILPFVGEILERYVREPGFPRPSFCNFYLSLIRLWCVLHGGNSAGQEHGHILLELANALLQLNANTNEVCQTLEDWWTSKPARSQLYFALDAIELMERELPGTESPANLWISAADVITRAVDSLPPSDCELWRRVGLRLGFDDSTISQYLPPELEQERPPDLLAVAGLQHVAIVCLREKQAEQAAEEIRKRTGAKLTVVTATSAGAETDQACTADVVLFVWLASTHAVFRAFDSFDRKKLSYVQGTGASSIVRSLERWVVAD